MHIIKRPTIVTVVCVIAFVVSVLSFANVFSPFIKKKGDFFPAINGLLIACEFISLVGVWYMKRWGLNLYLITAILYQALLIGIDNWAFYKVILPLFFIITVAFFYKKMDTNL